MRKSNPLNMVFIGLSITSSWGNGHAVTYRGLLAALARRGHRISFLEHDKPWYADHRDLNAVDYCRVGLYHSVAELQRRYAAWVREADVVVVGSYVPEGIAVGHWAVDTAQGLTAFYDIDTPVTVADLENNRCSYLSAELAGRFNLYLSFTGGPFLARIQEKYGLANVCELYCSADPELYYPCETAVRYDLGYMGTYSPDRQEALERLLIAPACAWPQGRFVVAGSRFPRELKWPDNVIRIEHIIPKAHRLFYNAQRFTLNLTRADMAQAGYSPSVRLFEAAACGTAIISDPWTGLEDLFVPGEQILIGRSTAEILDWLHAMDDRRRREMGRMARRRFLSAHTPDHRAGLLEDKIRALLAKSTAPTGMPGGAENQTVDGISDHDHAGTAGNRHRPRPNPG